MVAVILQPPRGPDARRHRRRARDRDLLRERRADRRPRVNAGTAATAGVLDRAAVAPITRGETPYERAVREALGRETEGGRRGLAAARQP